MPDFSTEIEIEPYEFVDECSKSEINELIDELIERGHLTPNSKSVGKKIEYTLMEETHRKYCDVLADCYYRMSKEDEETIMNIAKKYS